GTAGARVLVVDDEPNALSALATLLEDEGFVVETAANGLVALAKVREFAPDILVVDVEMPGLKGDDLVRKVREDITELPVILMTGHGDHVVAAARIELGASYVAKPFGIDELVSAIYRGLGKER
ncbi:MAG TPA: response regulator, partial [Kofleriaceae bacterium]